MEVVAAAGSAQDSGVDTEADQDSNDSSMSNDGSHGDTDDQPPAAHQQPEQPQQQQQNIAVDNFQVPLQQQQHSASAPASNSATCSSSPASSRMGSSAATPEPPQLLLMPPNGPQPPPSVTGDGYLGDCSSDGGNEKNFPMPADLLKRLGSFKSTSCHCHPEASGSSSSKVDELEPPAGIAFQNLAPASSSSSNSNVASTVNSLGYQVLPNNHQLSYRGSSSAPRKMRSSIRSRLVNNHNNWSQLKASLAEKKLRLAANTNNGESVTRLIANGASVNSSDEHQRTALHFAAAKGYAEVVKTLLENGAEPNAKDALGNTPLHLAACTNHIQVVTLLLRAGTDVTTLDNNGRTPMQLAQSKLKLLQKNSSTPAAAEMGKVKTEVAQVVDMMREYLSKTGAIGTNSAYSDLLNSFSQRLTLHMNHDEIHSDLQNLLDSLGNLHLTKV